MRKNPFVTYVIGMLTGLSVSFAVWVDNRQKITNVPIAAVVALKGETLFCTGYPFDVNGIIEISVLAVNSDTRTPLTGFGQKWYCDQYKYPPFP